VRLPAPGGPIAGVDRDAWAAAFALWPRRPARMAGVWTDFYAAMYDLASKIMCLLADAYDLPADEIPAWTDRQFSNLVVNYYPAQPTPPPVGQLRQHAHTDIGGLTLLWADDAPGGLEVLLPGEETGRLPGEEAGDRAWTPVRVPPGAFLIQAGDLLARWTNHRIRANVHRVVNPPAAIGSDAERFSVVFFHHPDLDAEVRPAPSCRRPGQREPRPVHAGTHVIRRQQGRPGGAEQPAAVA
jgi:isopenicillin N synthase-like dioxygenase